MSTNRMKIDVNGLKEGMFVADLDCPWHETPFPLQGFYIRQDDDVQALAEYCKYVYVDVKKQKAKTHYASHAAFKPVEGRRRNENPEDHVSLKLPPIVIKSPAQYESTSSIQKEVIKVKKLQAHVYEAIDNVYAGLENGIDVSVKETERVADGMVESIIRNPDAMVWLAKMNESDSHTYRHSVNASIWALVFGRHLGLDKKRLKTLAMGVLLSHIGKIKLDFELVERADSLTGSELQTYQSYVGLSVDMLDDMENLSSGVNAIVRFHQERHNGSGFPEGVTGEKIPLLAKIAGLVDHYQYLITPREAQRGQSPLEAVSSLYELRNIAFQKDLVEKFIEAVGVYPTGTLVELSSSEVGIVTGHNQERRLQPTVMVVLDPSKRPLKNGRLVDLMEYNRDCKESQSLYIRESLPKGAYDIDETQFLLTGAKSKWSWQHLKGSLAAS